MTTSRWILLLLVAGLFAAFFYFDLGSILTLERIKAEQASLQALLTERPLAFTLAFFLIYVLATAVSVPGAATVLTLAAGAVFGLLHGVLLVSFASTIGATLAMVLARWLFREQVEARFSSLAKRVNKGMEEEGAFYLFTLRLVPAFPFFAINLVMGLTRMKVLVFFVVSQIGMLAGTIVYVNAGTELAKIASPGGILSPSLIGSFVLLGIFPLLAKWTLGFLATSLARRFRARRLYRGHKKPARFDRDLIVIGAGSGGLVSALIAATVKAKVTLIEKHKMGGDCLHTGCVPSKTLIRSAKFAWDSRQAGKLGFPDSETAEPFAEFGGQFASVMQRVQGVISAIEPHDSVERYEGLGVAVEIGEGRIVSPWEVAVNGKVLTTRNIIIATGATPFVPGIENIESIDYYTSDNLWQMDELPRRTLVLGGGPIGTELAQAFSRLGSEVTQVELLPRILPREDPEFSEMIKAQLTSEGVRVLTDCKAEKVSEANGEKVLTCALVGDGSAAGDGSDGGDESAGRDGVDGRNGVDRDGVNGNGRDESGQLDIGFDALIVAVGRKAMVEGFGLQELGVALTDRGTVQVDEYLRSNFPNIFAVGDAAGPLQFTHTASHLAWYATVNALFGTFKKFKVDYSAIPWATFCYPEVARVGLNETEAKEQGVEYEVTRWDVAGLDRALADGSALGQVKVLTAPGSDRILGATIASDHAGDLITEFTLAMKHGLGLNKLLGTIHVYPTLMEMNKFAAGEWRRNHKPDWALKLAERYHAFRRGA